VGGMDVGRLVDLENDGDSDIVGAGTYWTGPVEVFEKKLK
jgi:hypothetical protein